VWGVSERRLHFSAPVLVGPRSAPTRCDNPYPAQGSRARHCCLQNGDRRTSPRFTSRPRGEKRGTREPVKREMKKERARERERARRESEPTFMAMAIPKYSGADECIDKFALRCVGGGRTSAAEGINLCYRGLIHTLSTKRPGSVVSVSHSVRGQEGRGRTRRCIGSDVSGQRTLSTRKRKTRSKERTDLQSRA
jgi:hypothetical protein